MTHLVITRQNSTLFSVSNKRKIPLGRISWFKDWKCWVWEQFDCVIMSQDCLEEVVDFMIALADKRICQHCGGNISIRNPSGNCDHLYYPQNCIICQRIEKQEAGYGKVCQNCPRKTFCEDKCDAFMTEIMKEAGFK